MKKIIIIFIIVSGIFFIKYWYKKSIGIDINGYNTFGAIEILDKNNILLAKLFPKFGGEFIKLKYNQFPKKLICAVISAEDKNFFRHNGVDFYALFRAVYLNLKHRKIVSGGSTITVQLIRNIYGWKSSFVNKFKELNLAIKLEKKYSKQEILASYLNRVFLGNNVYGVGAAAVKYFGKNVRDLSVGESAFLAAIIKSGTKFNPYKNRKKIERRRKYVLNRMLKNKYISKEEYELAVNEKMNLLQVKNKIKAPHFCFYIKQKLKEQGFKNVYKVRTTLDYRLQKTINKILKNHIQQRLKIKNVNNGAVVVLNAQTGDILAMVGSVNFYDKKNSGEVNGAVSLRQPGSALKPFLYLYVFSKGVSPASVISDIETHIPTVSGDYSPKNYDWKYHGPVSVRTALSCSYNIPAVKWLYKFSTYEYVNFLRDVGFKTINKPASFYGIGLALGTAEVRLLDIVHSYTVFANKGKLVKLNYIKNIFFTSGKELKIYKVKKIRKVHSDDVYLINNILTDRISRLRAFPGLKGVLYPFDIAIKTGTSKDYKDAWAIGYTKDYIVGVWLGNFDSEPMNKVSGGIGAIPILYDIFLSLNPWLKNKPFKKPANIVVKKVCALSGMLPGKYCYNIVDEVFKISAVQRKVCNFHKLFYKKQNNKKIYKVFTVYPDEYNDWVHNNNLLQPDSSWHIAKEQNIDIVKQRVKIIFPDNNDVFRLSPDLPVKYQKIELKYSVPVDTDYIECYIDNKIYKKMKRKDIVKWILKRGEHYFQIKAVIGKEIYISEKIRIFVQ